MLGYQFQRYWASEYLVKFLQKLHGNGENWIQKDTCPSWHRWHWQLKISWFAQSTDKFDFICAQNLPLPCQCNCTILKISWKNVHNVSSVKSQHLEATKRKRVFPKCSVLLSLEPIYIQRLRRHCNIAPTSNLLFWCCTRVFSQLSDLTFLSFLYKIDITGFKNQQKKKLPPLGIELTTPTPLLQFQHP